MRATVSMPKESSDLIASRFDAQLRTSERRASPRWPLAVVPVLVLGIAGVAALAWQDQQINERNAEERARTEAFAEQQAQTLAALDTKLEAFDAQHERMQQRRAQLDAKVLAAKGDAATEAALRKELDALDADIASNERARDEARTRVKPRSERPKPKPKVDAEPETKPRTRPALELSSSRDPLAGLE